MNAPGCLGEVVVVVVVLMVLDVDGFAERAREEGEVAAGEVAEGSEEEGLEGSSEEAAEELLGICVN